jgi:hypothetical protein
MDIRKSDARYPRLTMAILVVLALALAVRTSLMELPLSLEDGMLSLLKLLATGLTKVLLVVETVDGTVLQLPVAGRFPHLRCIEP